MTTLARASEYQKEYLPGYTGHVPSKNERFGSTAGQIKREILTDSGRHPITMPRIYGESTRLYGSKFVPAIDKNKIVYGNHSRFAKNWASGPNDMIRNQRVPGYTGHIKGLVSENIFSQSYANSSAKAIGKKHPIGHEVSAKERFLSQNTGTYRAKNFRRFIDQPLLQPRKDYDDYTRFINDTYTEEKEDMLSQTVSNLNRTGGFASKYSTGYNPLNTLRTYSEKPSAFPSKKPFRGRNLSMVVGGNDMTLEKRLGSTITNFDVKPKILESKISTQTDFFNLSDGFKKIFAHDRQDQKLILPIAGYGGHRRGDRS